MTPYQAHRDARLIELDMLDLCELVKDGEPLPDYRPLMKKLSDRVGRLADALHNLEQVSAQQVKDAERWKLLHEQQGITWSEYPGKFSIFRELPRGLKLIGQGKSLTEAVDRALGYIK